MSQAIEARRPSGAEARQPPTARHPPTEPSALAAPERGARGEQLLRSSSTARWSPTSTTWCWPEVEAPLLEAVLQHTRNNQTLAATVLGLNRGTLRKKLETLRVAVSAP